MPLLSSYFYVVSLKHPSISNAKKIANYSSINYFSSTLNGICLKLNGSLVLSLIACYSQGYKIVLAKNFQLHLRCTNLSFFNQLWVFVRVIKNVTFITCSGALTGWIGGIIEVQFIDFILMFSTSNLVCLFNNFLLYFFPSIMWPYLTKLFFFAFALICVLSIHLYFIDGNLWLRISVLCFSEEIMENVEVSF